MRFGIALAHVACLWLTLGASGAEEKPVFVGDSASMQTALDAAAERGGIVQLEAGRYRIDRAVMIPEGVTLAGVWQAPHHAQLKRGTVLEITADEGNENGPAAFGLSPSSCIRGVTFFYPRQQVPEVRPYPWTVQGRGMHGSVIDCTFVNAYKAIDFGTHHNELHYIRNCFGSPLKMGVHIDQCTDIGRIENVHFNPHYWVRSGAGNAPTMAELRKYLFANLVAFNFGRSDWEYVHDTFCFGARVGYRFIKSDVGSKPFMTNGNFLGIGADWCERAVLVEGCQMPGLLITNGEFVGAEESGAMIEVAEANNGPVQFSNCSFWGPCDTAAILAGGGMTSFNQCTFLNFIRHNPDAHTIEVNSGDVSIQNCRFGIDKPDIRLAGPVRSAIILGNWFSGTREIHNLSAGDVQVGYNVPGTPPATRPAQR